MKLLITIMSERKKQQLNIVEISVFLKLDQLFIHIWTPPSCRVKKNMAADIIIMMILQYRCLFLRERIFIIYVLRFTAK